MKIIRSLLLALTFGTLLAGCESESEKVLKELNSVERMVKSQLDGLKTHLKNDRIQNAVLLKKYGEYIKTNKPEMSEIADALMLDAAADGPAIQSLYERLNRVKAQIPAAAERGNQGGNELLPELRSISNGANTDIFNLKLSDPVNVLAQMSDGKLPPVSLDGVKEEDKANEQVAHQLVGNPQYGSWQTNASGGTFWAWYGQYAFFSNLFGGPYRYSTWAGTRGYSYYNDAGRDYYTSPQQRREYAQTENRVRKTYQTQGKKFQSPYATKPKSQSTKNRLTRPNKFNSAYASNNSSNRSSSSKSNSYRSRSSGRSRSSRGGGK